MLFPLFPKLWVHGHASLHPCTWPMSHLSCHFPIIEGMKEDERKILVKREYAMEM
ncbi:mCG147171 [Mus musculus]|nr:mCG147171 [Mus musculus]